MSEKAGIERVRIYLDSCIVIYLNEGTPAIRTSLWRQLRTAFAEKTVGLSPLTRMECRVLPLRQQNSILLAKYDYFFRRSGARFIPMGAAVYELATKLRASQNIKSIDALHLAAARTDGCTAFWTNDSRLARAAEGVIELIVPKIAAGNG